MTISFVTCQSISSFINSFMSSSSSSMPSSSSSSSVMINNQNVTRTFTFSDDCVQSQSRSLKDTTASLVALIADPTTKRVIVNPNDTDKQIEDVIFIANSRFSYGKTILSFLLCLLNILVSMVGFVHTVSGGKGSLGPFCEAIPGTGKSRIRLIVLCMSAAAGSFQNWNGDKSVPVEDERIVQSSHMLSSLYEISNKGERKVVLGHSTPMCLVTNKLPVLVTLFSNVNIAIIHTTFLMFFGLTTKEKGEGKVVAPNYYCITVELFQVIMKLCLGTISIEDPYVQRVLKKSRPEVIRSAFTIVNQLVTLTSEHRKSQNNNPGRMHFADNNNAVTMDVDKQLQGYTLGMFSF